MTPDQEYSARLALEESQYAKTKKSIKEIDDAIYLALLLGYIQVNDVVLLKVAGLLSDVRLSGYEFVGKHTNNPRRFDLFKFEFEQEAKKYGGESAAIAASASIEIASNTKQLANQDGITNNKEVARIARAELNLRRQARAEGHAIDAVHGAVEAGKYILTAAAIGQTKTWWTRRDSRVRPTHAAAHGQTVGINETFTVGGYSMKYPQDSRAPAKETARCRCVAVYGGGW